MRTGRGASRLLQPHSAPILLGAVLYLLATSRWGSYLSVPGLPVFVGDLLLAAALVQVVLVLARQESPLRTTGRAVVTADLALPLCLALLVWSVLRGAVGLLAGPQDVLTFLRDAAPYGYVVAALAAFVLPAPRGRHRVVYAVLAFHALWLLVGRELPGWPWGGIGFGGGVPFFSPRPDVDSAVAGVAIAFAVHDLLLGRRPRRPAHLAWLGLFLAANVVLVSSLQTRAGLLASIVAVGAVVGTWVLQDRKSRSPGPAWTDRRVLAVLAGCLLVVGATSLTGPGQRLVQSVTGQESQALGTLLVREFAWSGVTSYVLADPVRTAVGVGFGPDFIADSGTEYALEGTEYSDVRSPHNYVLGTLARLGVAGAVLAILTMAAGARLALRRLGATDDPLSVLASLVLLTLPVTALLGVVLESPFGAIPYFWAIGHLAREGLLARRSGDVVEVPAVQRRHTVA